MAIWKRKAMRRKIRAKKWKSKKGYKTLVNVNHSLAPIAQRYITKMKYAEVVSSGAGGGVYGRYQFNLNSIFDPSLTGIGHQPYGHDTLQTMYGRYRVIACRYRVSINSFLNQYLQLAVIPTNDNVTPVNIAEVRENPRAKYTLQAPGAPQRFVSGNVYLPSLMGRTKSQYMADDRFQA